MYYLVDGYNLIFSLILSKGSLQTLRHQLILTLKKQFAAKKIAGTLVFDGAHRKDEESGLSYPTPLIVAYAPQGQSADAYIVERIELSATPKEIVVVTNDRGLGRHAKAAGAQVQDNDAFVQWLYKKKKGGKTIVPKESQKNIDRLLKIFEERLKNGEE
ncbi:MAG: NYN domain-containing protein [Chlamydiales bacterium]